MCESLKPRLKSNRGGENKKHKNVCMIIVHKNRQVPTTRSHVRASFFAANASYRPKNSAAPAFVCISNETRTIFKFINRSSTIYRDNIKGVEQVSLQDRRYFQRKFVMIVPVQAEAKNLADLVAPACIKTCSTSFGVVNLSCPTPVGVVNLSRTINFSVLSGKGKKSAEVKYSPP